MSVNHDIRIKFLDGLRGVAILLVILYHAYSRWPGLVPYGNSFSFFPIFHYGYLGVQLFFLISGFVILMTLEKCTNFQDFILRRWLRLFPAMLICSFIILSTASMLPERPNGQIFYYDMLPGLTFIEPSWWSKTVGFELRNLDGAFWSLYVEVKFYLIFGSLYFIFGSRKAIITLFVLFCISTIEGLLRKIAPNFDFFLIREVINLLSAQYYGWFVAGSLYYIYFRMKKKHFMIYAIVVAAFSALAQDGYRWDVKIPALIICFIFTSSLVSNRMQYILSNPVLLSLGIISYPLYLIHQNMMIALIVKIGHHIPPGFSLLVPFIPITIVIGLGWFITTYLEPWTKEQLRLIIVNRF